MKMTVQLVVCEDDGREETITDVVILEKTCQQIEQVGLTLAEAKSLLAALQQHLVERQASAFVATRTHCQACGALLSTKGHHALTFRTPHSTQFSGKEYHRSSKASRREDLQVEEPVACGDGASFDAY
jgi:hypothetical protein